MVVTPLDKANVLIEALPYIKEFYGKTIVVKLGGHAMVSPELKNAVIQDLTLMKFVGMNPVVVHGGGPEINAMLQRLGIKTSFVQGQRVTDEETMDIVEMVLAGKVNKEIVSLINKCGASAIGLSGKDGNLILARRKFFKGKGENGEEFDYDIGYVGEIVRINPEVISSIISQGYIPVVAPIGAGENGESYNINADYVAGELAVALKADKLVLLTDVEGIFADPDDKDSLISSLKVSSIQNLIDRGIINGGMIPKVQCCARAVLGGVGRTHIIDGRIPHSILLEIFTHEGIGTMVVK
ncbi:MAG TPA: acetylglutamate kinase [Peptococcaceae bacterium]|nr:MAG: Acetylglutamate kinase [Clostridia bacterium 41_269]HBT20914.1 acetylglutamate kinase [Peptococcaceae bacterium]